MLVRELMTKKVYTVRESERFGTIVNLLIAKKISGVPVINKNNKLIGIISEKDLLHKLFPKEEDFYKDINYYKNFRKIELEASHLSDLTAQDIMTKKVITVRPDNHVLVACSLIAIHDIRRLPVVDNGRIVGIVTTNNLYKSYLSSFISKSKGGDLNV